MRSTSSGRAATTSAPATADGAELHARARRRRSATAASRPRRRGASGAWSCARGAQWLHARVEDSRDAGARRPAADQRARALTLHAAGAPTRWPPLPGPGPAGGGTLRERAQGAARQQRADPRLRPRRSRRALRDEARRRRRWTLARRHRQRLRPPRLARIALPVRPRLPVSRSRRARGACRCRPTSERPRATAAGYNSRLFLDSSVGRAPDC